MLLDANDFAIPAKPLTLALFPLLAARVTVV